MVGHGHGMGDHVDDDRRASSPSGCSATCSTGCSGSSTCSCRSGSSWAAPRACTSSGFDTGGERVTRPEPERELIRRVSPFALPAAILAYVVGALFGGADAGWSAVIAIVHRLPQLPGERVLARVGRLGVADARQHRRARRLRGPVDHLHARARRAEPAGVVLAARVRARAGPGHHRAARLRDEGAVRPHAGRPLDVRRSASTRDRRDPRRHVRTAQHGGLRLRLLGPVVQGGRLRPCASTSSRSWWS